MCSGDHHYDGDAIEDDVSDRKHYALPGRRMIAALAPGSVVVMMVVAVLLLMMTRRIVNVNSTMLIASRSCEI